ncbi:MAG: phosphatase PAP2 family protein [Clostridiales Family XIII bacterium]|nr:phosphatase PAP2 family protein [Clostridiales Family XIII bacterium]
MDRYLEKRNLGIRWIFFVIFLALFAADAYFVISGKSASFDTLVQETIFDLRTGPLTSVLTVITHFADTKVIGALCILLIILPNRMKFGLPIALATGLGSCVHYGLKHFIERARPDEAMWLVPEDGFSFPSGHSNAGLIFFMFVAVLLGRYLIMGNSRFGAFLLRFLLGLLVFVIGVSRIYVGVHYPTDVLGGWSLGIALLILFLILYDFAWPAKWRVSYEPPKWSAIPLDYEKNKNWKMANKKHATGELLEFPKHRSAWKMPNKSNKETPNPDDR